MSSSLRARTGITCVAAVALTVTGPALAYLGANAAFAGNGVRGGVGAPPHDAGEAPASRDGEPFEADSVPPSEPMPDGADPQPSEPAPAETGPAGLPGITVLPPPGELSGPEPSARPAGLSPEEPAGLPVLPGDLPALIVLPALDTMLALTCGVHDAVGVAGAGTEGVVPSTLPACAPLARPLPEAVHPALPGSPASPDDAGTASPLSLAGLPVP